MIPKCESITILKAFCGICKEEEADFTLRTIKNENEIYIGGADIYKPVCRKCFHDCHTLEKDGKIDLEEKITKGKVYKL